MNMETLELTNFTRKKQQPTDEERAKLRYRLYQFSNFNRISKTFKRTPQQIQQAFEGKQPSLMNRIASYIKRREQKINSKN